MKNTKSLIAAVAITATCSANAALVTFIDEDFSSGLTPVGATELGSGTPTYSGSTVDLGPDSWLQWDADSNVTDNFVMETIADVSTFQNPGFGFLFTYQDAAFQNGYGLLFQGGDLLLIRHGLDTTFVATQASLPAGPTAFALSRENGELSVWIDRVEVLSGYTAGPNATTATPVFNLNANSVDGAGGNGIPTAEYDRFRFSRIDAGGFTATDLIIPEPSSTALVGLAGFSLLLRRRK